MFMGSKARYIKHQQNHRESLLKDAPSVIVFGRAAECKWRHRRFVGRSGLLSICCPSSVPALHVLYVFLVLVA